MSDIEIVAASVAFVVMLIGVAGIVVPMLPDLPLIWLAGLGYGLVAGFDGWVGGVAMTLLTVLMVLGIVADLALGPAGAAKSGASWQAIAAGIGLGLVGLFFFPPLGPIVGALLGVFLVEYYRRNQNSKEAWEAVKGYAVGCGWSMVARLLLAGLMMVIWGVWVWVGRG